jgi:hypothetical protein
MKTRLAGALAVPGAVPKPSSLTRLGCGPACWPASSALSGVNRPVWAQIAEVLRQHNQQRGVLYGASGNQDRAQAESGGAEDGDGRRDYIYALLLVCP